METSKTTGNNHAKEGSVAKAIESTTSQMPSDWFLWAAVASIIGSALLKNSGREDDAQFVGQWAPTILILGLYNKIVKTVGSE